MIRVVTITNPIEPSRDPLIQQLAFDGEVLGLVLFFGVHPGMSAGEFDVWAETVDVSVNGHVWPQSLWGEVRPRDGDCIVIAPLVRGGGILRTLATVAVMAGAAAATFFSAGAGVALFGLTSTITASLIGGVVSIGGNMLVSALLGPAAPSEKTQSASYDPDGPKTLARSGTVIPRGGGAFRPGGNIISQFTDLEGPNQYVNALWCGGFGPARAIRKVQLNGKDIDTYQNVQMFVRLGSNDQTPIQGFNRIVNGYPQEVQCLAGQPVVVIGTGDDTVALQVDIQFPAGIFWMDSGNLNSEVITYQVQYRASNMATATAAGQTFGTWYDVLQPYSTADLITYDSSGNPIASYGWYVRPTDRFTDGTVAYAADNGPHTPGDPWQGNIPTELFGANGNHSNQTLTFKGEWQPLLPGLNPTLVTAWRNGYVDFVANSNSPLYNRTTIYGLPAGKWDVRVIKYGSAHLHDNVQFGDNNSPLVGQQMWIHSVNEIALEDLAYPNQILVGVRFLATNQLSGSNLNITAEIDYGLRSIDEGLMPAELLAYEEDNPACIAADALLDTLYGGGQAPGVKTANLERYIDQWVDWADLNDELVDDGNGNSIRRHVFNGVFDSEGNLWNALRQVGQMSRAQVMPYGKDYGVFVDRAVDAPVQMFTVGNISKDSFQETWLELDSRANQVEIQFADRDRYYRTDNPLIYMDPAFQNAGVTPKNTRIDGKGITIKAQAWHSARFRERCNQFLLRTGVFKTDISGVACRAGNVVLLQHDVPQWGTGGRTLPGSTTTRLRIDRDDAPFVTGTSYTVVVLFPKIQRYSGTVSTTAASTTPKGITVSIAGWTDADRVTRAVVNGHDCAILASEAGSVVVDPPPGFTPASGQSCVLWDTDVLESAAVTGIDARSGALILGAPLPQVPEDFSTYIYGVTGANKLVRVLNIKKANEQRATLEWIDYDARCYTDAVPVLGGVASPSVTNAGVSSLLGSEIFDITGGNYVSSAKLTWKMGQTTVGVAIYGRSIGGTAVLPMAPIPLIARLTGHQTSWQRKLPVGETWKFVVVGFDAQNSFAPFATAPSVTVEGFGIAKNLLLGSSFASGFTYWSVMPRAGDTFVPSFADDGEAVLTVAATALTASQTLAVQIVPPAKWAVGDTMLLSAYLEDECADPLAPNTGNATISIRFHDAGGTLLSSVSAEQALDGTAPTLTRLHTAVATVPTSTATVSVAIGLSGSSLSLPVASTLTMSHFLLENPDAGQTLPKEWADIDALGNILDIFTLGSSSGLRVQGSSLPTFTGNITYTSTDSTITIVWSGLAILWPDGAHTFVNDGSLEIDGLSASSSLWAFLYFDVINGGMALAIPAAGLGTPALLSADYDVLADAACRQDGRVPMTPGGLQVATAAAGGGGGGGGRDPGDPTLPITLLPNG